jgi:hypothetical protein
MKRFFLNFGVMFFVLGILYSKKYHRANTSNDQEDPWEPFVEDVSHVQKYLGPETDSIKIDTTFESNYGPTHIFALLVITGYPFKQMIVLARIQRADSIQLLQYSLTHSSLGWDFEKNKADATTLQFIQITQTLLEKAIYEKRERRRYNPFRNVTAFINQKTLLGFFF